MNILVLNARVPPEEISRILHIQRQAIHQRIKKLKEDGAIKGYRNIIDWAKLGEIYYRYGYYIYFINNNRR
ncbi:winged helix-turn-helix transcriptional regulator [Clostridium sp. FP1]|nr:winged helix-turn-helix transcriptional regulator [Clostridium sp. FP1]